MLELRHLRTLLALAETGSLTVAAERLHLTQSALSHQLRELEDRLACPLFDRAARPLRPTQAGWLLIELARAVLPQTEATLARIRGLAQGRVGRLAIASECHSCLEWLLPRLRDYRRAFPGIELDVVFSASLDPLPRLQEGSLDLVLTPDRRGLPGMHWQRLFDYTLRLLVAPEHPLAGRPWVSPAELGEQTLLVYPVERGRLDIFSRFLWPAGVEPARVRAVDSTALLIELTALGQGVTALPDWACATACAQGRVVALGLGEAGLPCTLWACVREADTMLPHLQGFLRLLPASAAGQ